MNNQFGVSTGIAVVAMAKSHAARKPAIGYGDRLIAEDGAAATLGRSWNEGAAMIKKGRGLAGWFAGRQRNLKARVLIDRGLTMQHKAESDYELITVSH